MAAAPSSIINKSPHIAWYRNFFTAEECGYLLQIKDHTFARKKVNEYGEGVQDIHFTYSFSQTITLDQFIYLDLAIKLVEFFDLQSFTQVDGIYVVKYPIGGYIVPHVDGGPAGSVTRRRSTFILYLNDNYSGGHLKFNNLSIVVQPKSGCGVYFEYPTMEINNRLLHESTPNTGAEKFCIPFFIRTPEYIEEYRAEWQKKYGPEISKLPNF